MKYYFVFFLILIVFVGWVSQASAQEQFWQKEDMVIEGGDITKVTYDFKSGSVKIQVEIKKEGYIIIPNLHHIAADPDCTPSDEGLFVLVDNTETDVFQIDDEQNMKITLHPNSEKVEIISSHVLVLHTYSSIYGEFCKMLDEGNHASPYKQLEMGFLVKDIICKDGLELIFHTITNNPACVTDDNVEKFYQRGYSTENFFSLPFSEIYKLKDSIIRYSIYDATLESVEFDGKVIRFNVDSGKNGMLSVSIPREILIDEDSQNAVDLRHRDCRSETYSHDFSSTHLMYLKIFGENTKRIEFGCNFESNR